jgi:hypothetical protein
MPEQAGQPGERVTATLERTEDGAGAPRGQSFERGAADRLFFGLGVGVQTLLWFLLFLALVVAVAVGGELTEFRYVGF